MIPNLIKGKRVLVTGGGGFIGGCLVRRLLASSRVTVFNLDKISYSSDLKSIKALGFTNRHFLLKVDLSNSEATHKAIKEADPDLVIHLAAESHVDRSIDQPSDFLYSNVIGTFNLLESIRAHYNRLSHNRELEFRFLHVSTDEVFGSLDSTGSFCESTTYNPRSPYSSTKAASDHLVSAWHHTYGLPTLITNCSNNYGPWQFPEKLIPLSINKAINQKEIPIYGDGKHQRDWLFVDDHIDALILTLTNGKPGNKYCIGTGNEKTNLEVVTSICNILDQLHPARKPYASLIKLVEDRPGHDKRYSIDCTKIKVELGWEQKHSFKSGLEKTVKWYLANQEWCTDISNRSQYQGERMGIKK